MGTTNILDLNNRLSKVEKENVAQNSYTSLKNKPKINGVTLTGNKSLADIGAAAAADLTTLEGDVGEISEKINDTTYVEVVADGVKTRAALLNELYSLVDLSKITKMSVFTQIDTLNNFDYYVCAHKSPNDVAFSRSLVIENVGLNTRTNTLSASSNSFDCIAGTTTDNSAAVVTNGYKYRVIY